MSTDASRTNARAKVMIKRGTPAPSLAAMLVSATLAVGATATAAAGEKYAPGITDTEIKIGQSAAYSGPAAVVGTMTRAHGDYFKMINEHGGVNGRKLVLISLDDGFNPARTVANARTLVEDDRSPSCSAPPAIRRTWRFCLTSRSAVFRFCFRSPARAISTTRKTIRGWSVGIRPIFSMASSRRAMC